MIEVKCKGEIISQRRHERLSFIWLCYISKVLPNGVEERHTCELWGIQVGVESLFSSWFVSTFHTSLGKYLGRQNKKRIKIAVGREC